MATKYTICDKEYGFSTDIRENEQIRKSFNLLARNTFGLDFEPWYQKGYWGSDYIPYVLMDGAMVVSNVSVNIINTRWEGQVRRYIQLGTIMTSKEYRGRGLSRWLMKKVLDDWKDKCDAVYLFANDSVLDFYPKFGFIRASEYQCHKDISKMDKKARKLDMSKAQDRQLLLSAYKLSNPFSALPMEGNEGLLMFYCSQFMKENVYYIEQYEAVVIAEYDDESLLCYDVFCQHKCTLDDILCALAEKTTRKAVLGFAPKQVDSYEITELHEEDTTLFILSGKENLFINNKLMFPLLSHA